MDRYRDDRLGGFIQLVGGTNTGGRYNPITDSWIATSTVNAPDARFSHTAVWTGSEMIVWGGVGCGGNCRLDTGGKYNPTTDSWTATNRGANLPEGRWNHTAAWTGEEMIVWGGTNSTIGLNTGGKYNPATDSWTPTSTANAPLGRVAHTSIWSGSEMVVWGGVDSTPSDLNTGGRYNPAEDSWRAISTLNAPSPRDYHTGVWTGGEMIIWGGEFGSQPPVSLDTGGRYDPGMDSWRVTGITNVPHARNDHTSVWTGDKNGRLGWLVLGGGQPRLFEHRRNLLRAIRFANSNAHADFDSHCNSNADRDTHADCDAHRHTNADLNSDPQPDSDANAWTDW